jgi:hypothetical protein
MRRSINFIEEWQSSSSIPVSTPTLMRSRSNSINPTVPELGDSEDFMLAFHGFEIGGNTTSFSYGSSSTFPVNRRWSCFVSIATTSVVFIGRFTFSCDSFGSSIWHTSLSVMLKFCVCVYYYVSYCTLFQSAKLITVFGMQ